MVDFSFNDDGNVLLLQTSITVNGIKEEGFRWVDLETSKSTAFWTATQADERIIGYSFDKTGTQLVFLVQQQNDNKTNAIWYYNKGMSNAVLKVNNQSSGITTDLTISSASPYFSATGQYILFALDPQADTKTSNPEAVKMDVWSYQDEILQSTQLLWGKSIFVPGIDKKISAVINIKENSVKIMSHGDEQIYYSSPVSDFVILSNGHTKRYTESWWRTAHVSASLVCLNDMSRKLIESGDHFGENSFSFSPDGKFFVYFNPHINSYWSCDLTSC